MTIQSHARREVLKFGALAALPVAGLVPSAASAADDGSRARLAVLEDERAIREAARAAIARFNAGACGDVACFDPAISAVVEDAAAAAEIALNGDDATYRRAATVARSTAFTGQTTIEKMARFQGHEAASKHSAGLIEARLTRTADGWTITRLALA
ncbi:MAG: hypothetical protein V4647_14785 [Pseudomonadota bacterium]